MLHKNWIITNKYPKDIIKAILSSRGIKDAKSFYNPINPLKFSLKKVGINESEVFKAKKRLKTALKRRETVVIYGDYDVDGVSATSLLWQTLNKFGLEVYPFVPDRFEDGYGMSISGINKILEKYPNTSLIITVDNGIVAKEAIAYANQSNIEVIITDHHEKNGPLKSFATVHTTKMCGTAIAWFLSKSLIPKEKEYLSESLDLVGLATIADQMKLSGINRSLAYFGILALRNSKRLGLKALCTDSGISQRDIGTYEIGFVLGPRINAAGRLADALVAVRLFCTKNRELAKETAFDLGNLNTSRQEILARVIQETKGGNTHENIILVSGDFHEGVIGLTAGRLVEEFGKPAVVFSTHGEIVKASARSVAGFHITEFLRGTSSLPINVGGHEMAAGLSIHKKDLDEYIEVLTNEAKNIDSSLFIKKRHIDCLIHLNEVTLPLETELKRLEPFGIGNPKPVFLTESMTVLETKLLGKKSEHLKLIVKEGKAVVEALFFNFKQNDPIRVGDKISLVYTVDKNEWNGNVKVQILIKDYIIEHERRIPKTRKRVQKTSKKSSLKKKR